jgi:hypothetical protein
MDISGLESLVRNHPVLFTCGALAGAYITTSLLVYLKIRRGRKEIKELKKEVRFYVDFLKDSHLLEDPKIRKVYDRGVELMGNNLAYNPTQLFLIR